MSDQSPSTELLNLLGSALVIKKSDPLIWDRLKKIPEESVFGCPTDTIYGLSGLYKSKAAQNRIQALKKRDNNQFIILVRSFLDAEILCEINENQRRQLLKYWPGPITFILKARDSATTLALRFPNDDFLIQIMESLGGPIISTSCNLSGESPVENALMAAELFQNQVDFYLDNESPSQSLSSTLVDLIPEIPKLIRPGQLEFEPVVPAGN